MQVRAPQPESADPVHPDFFSDTLTNFQKCSSFTSTDQGNTIEILMPARDPAEATSGIYMIKEVFSRQCNCAGQFISAYGLAHESDEMEALHTKMIGCTDIEAVGHSVILHVCDGRSSNCTASDTGSYILHFDAFRILADMELTFEHFHENTKTQAFAPWQSAESKSQRVQN